MCCMQVRYIFHIEYKMDIEHFINEMTHKPIIFKNFDKNVTSLSLVDYLLNSPHDQQNIYVVFSNMSCMYKI